MLEGLLEGVRRKGQGKGGVGGYRTQRDGSGLVSRLPHLVRLSRVLTGLHRLPLLVLVLHLR